MKCYIDESQNICSLNHLQAQYSYFLSGLALVVADVFASSYERSASRGMQQSVAESHRKSVDSLAQRPSTSVSTGTYNSSAQ